MNIDWTPPEPRPGLLKEWDTFIGPGQTTAEAWLVIVPAILAGIAAPLYAILTGLDWSVAQFIIASLMALDLTGGVVANATTAAKRWYHRKGQGWGQHMAFVAVHVVHIFLIAWLFRDGDWLYLLVFSLYLLAASAVVLWMPLYLQRPVALLIYCVVLLVGIYMFPASPGMEWFIPVFFIKLLVSHLLKEAPYPPGADV